MKNDMRKNIKVDEVVYQEFSDMSKATGKTHNKLLKELLTQGSYEETLKINNRIE